MMLALLALLAGFVLLIWSADRFIDGAAMCARHLGMPSLLIGLVIVGFGTSAPEIMVSAVAALNGNPSLALGNALGSNIANIGLILSITALVCPLFIQSKIVRRELPLLLGLSFLLGVLLWQDGLSRTDAALLLCCFALVMAWTIYEGLQHQDDPLKKETEKELLAHSMTFKQSLFWLVLGLLVLMGSSQLLVWGAVTIAKAFGMSELFIGLTIVALGTSLPELAASLTAAKKGEHDIAIGNIVGSNLFNLLAVIGISGAIAPIPELDIDVLQRDWLTMMALTLSLLLMAYANRPKHKISRLEGGVLLSIFLIYYAYLMISTLTSP